MNDVSPLIQVEELAADTARYLVFDCRTSLADHNAGRRAYLAGHLPGALFADLEQDLSAEPGAGGRHPLPDREDFIHQVQQWGVNADSRVVCYDDAGGAFAARLWWMFRWLGHARVQVLDGGLGAWLAADKPLSTEIPSPSPGNFQVKAPLTRICAADDIDASSQLLLDARDGARFRGEVEPIDRIAGHIPGAVSAPFNENLDQGRFREPSVLNSRFAQLGASDNSAIVCYCGSGVTAAHNILALRVAGYPEPALYPGSWSGWISDPDRPIATGE